eukprot:15143788-Alexandrium_andersonii.AAC.1
MDKLFRIFWLCVARTAKTLAAVSPSVTTFANPLMNVGAPVLVSAALTLSPAVAEPVFCIEYTIGSVTVRERCFAVACAA